ncbi:MAG: TonB-dependent receptor [Deltaproteobacteria bacterium]|nr:TonB-dependent receptor [Deltaproteobacteria bacterium]
MAWLLTARSPFCWVTVASALTLHATATAAAEPAATSTTRHTEFTTVVSERRARDGVAAQSIGRADIERQGALGAVEVLERTAAVNATSGSRGERIYQLRGFDQRQTVVLLNGAPLEIPYDGQVDLALIPAAALDQVLVLKGAVPTTYGTNGLGGAVNLVTRWPGAGPLVATSSEVAPGEYRLTASQAASAGPLSWSIWGGDSQSEGWRLPERYAPTALQGAGQRRNSDRRLSHGGAEVGWQIDPRQRLRASLLLVDGERGVPPSTVDDTPQFWRFTTWRALATAVSHEVRSDPHWQLDQMWYVQRFDNLLDSYDDASYSTQQTARAYHSWFHDTTVGGRARLQYRSSPSARSLTARTEIGAQRESHQKEQGEPTPEYARLLLVAAPGISLSWSSRWQASAGCQLDAEIPEPRAGMSPRPAASAGPVVALQHQLLPALDLRGAIARRTRFATLKERYATAFGARLANPALTAESAWHFELDAMWRPARWLSLDAGAFDAEVDDLIERVYLGNGVEQMRNTGAARFAGVELAARWRPLRPVEASASYLALQARHPLSGDERIEYRPAHRGVVALSWRPIEQVALWSLLRVVGPQDFRDPNTRRWLTLGWYTVADARVEATLRDGLAVWLRATNLLDTSYQTEIGYPDPGRQVWAGIRLSLDR